jgi:pimeloyl-ACP methyl ester carboxylesterase
MNRPRAYEGMPFFNAVLAKSARWLPWFTKLIRWQMRGMVMGDIEKTTRQLMSSIPAADKAVLYAPQDFEMFVSAVREGLRPGSLGVACDDILINQAWGFDPAGVQPRIDIWHGEADVNVPLHAARFLCAVIPHTRVTFLPGKGHFFLFNCWQDVLSRLVSEA